jgi:hypothetical protein
MRVIMSLENENELCKEKQLHVVTVVVYMETGVVNGAKKGKELFHCQHNCYPGQRVNQQNRRRLSPLVIV